MPFREKVETSHYSWKSLIIPRLNLDMHHSLAAALCSCEMLSVWLMPTLGKSTQNQSGRASLWATSLRQ